MTSSQRCSLPIFTFLSLSPLRLQAPHFIPINWEPPPINWVKINTDGSFHNPNRAGFGGIFRGARPSFLGAFSCKADVLSAIEVEILAVIEAVRVAWNKHWSNLWLETDSSLVVHYFKAPHLVPWRFKTSWANCLHIVRKLNFRVSHVYREGNSVADVLANYGAAHEGSHWWDTLPQFLVFSYGHDASSGTSYRFA